MRQSYVVSEQHVQFMKDIGYTFTKEFDGLTYQVSKEQNFIHAWRTLQDNVIEVMKYVHSVNKDMLKYIDISSYRNDIYIEIPSLYSDTFGYKVSQNRKVKDYKKFIDNLSKRFNEYGKKAMDEKAIRREIHKHIERIGYGNYTVSNDFIISSRINISIYEQSIERARQSLEQQIKIAERLLEIDGKDIRTIPDNYIKNIC